MHIHVLTYPRRTLFDGKVDPSMTVGDFIEMIGTHHPDFSTEGRALILDRNQNFHRITIDDAINRHYNGRLGELFRITDGSAVRYRLVSPVVPISKEKGKAKEKRVTEDVYAQSYANALIMLRDRGCCKDNPDTLSRYSIPRDQLIAHYQQGTFSNLTIPGLDDDEQLIDSRGRAVYVFFLSPEEDIIISRRGVKFRSDLVIMMNDIVKHHNSLGKKQMPNYDIEDLNDPKTVSAFADMFEIIIVYNNPSSKSEYDPGIKPAFHQSFPVQNLSFVVTQHIDQPKFELMDADADRAEIRNMYAQNGRTLDHEKTLESYGLRVNIRLMLI